MVLQIRVRVDQRSESEVGGESKGGHWLSCLIDMVVNSLLKLLVELW